MLSRIWAKWTGRARGAPPHALAPAAPSSAPVEADHVAHVEPPALPMPDVSPLALVKSMRALQPAVRQYLHPTGVADDLVRWCQQEGYVGWLTVDEVRAAWKTRHEMIGVSSCTMEMVLAALAERPDVRKRRVRLAMSPDYAEVRRRLQILGKAADRAIIYFIPPSPEDAVAMAAERAAQIAAGNPPPAPPVSKPGRRPAGASSPPGPNRSNRSLADQGPGSSGASAPAPALADLFARDERVAA